MTVIEVGLAIRNKLKWKETKPYFYPLKISMKIEHDRLSEYNVYGKPSL